MDVFVTRDGSRMRSLSKKGMRRSQRVRPKTTVSIRMPEDIVEDLTEMAPVWGCGSYEALIRLYIGEGLRRDEAKLEEPEVKELGDKLQREGLPEEVILERVAETLQKIA